jgi:membrane protein DedA with SNARE-associated domain
MRIVLAGIESGGRHRAEGEPVDLSQAALWLLPYAGITFAAIVEGEVAYIGAAALVAEGRLHPLAVFAAGALGASIGDQTYFYIFRGRLPRWLARFPSLQQKTAPLIERVRRHAALMVLLIRFAPGLRIALAAACAAVDVPPATFSVLDALSSLVWASALLILVAWFGPPISLSSVLTVGRVRSRPDW